MDNVWNWESEDERRKREQAAPLQGVQYKQAGEAPPPQQAPAQKTDPLTQYGTAKAIGAADKQLEKGAESIWESGKQALVNMNNAPTAEANQAILSDSSVTQVGAPMVEAPITVTPLIGETATAAPLSAALEVGAGEGARVVGGELLAGAATDALATAAADTAVTAGTTALAEGALAAGAGAAAEGTMLAAMGPVGWGIGAVLLAQQFGLFG